MDTWEYRLGSLVVGAYLDGPQTVTEWADELSGLGGEGWEAVGPVTLLQREPGTDPYPVELLLLKRRREA